MNQHERIEIEVVLNDRDVLRALGRITDRLNDLVIETGNVTGALGNIDRSLNETGGVLETAIGNFDLFGAAIGTAVGALTLLQGKLTLLALPVSVVIGILGALGLAGAFRNIGESAGDAGEDVYSFTERLMGLGGAYEDMSSKMAGAVEQMDLLKEAFSEGQISLFDYMKQIGLLKSEYYLLNFFQNRMYEQMEEGWNTIQEYGLQYEMLSETQQNVVDRMVNEWDRYAEMGSTMFRKLATESELSLYDIANNMDYNLNATENWQRNLSIITEKYGEEVAEHIRAMGEDGIAVAAMMSEEVLGYYKVMEDGTLQSLNGMESGAKLEGARIAENLTQAGELATDGIVLRAGEGAEAFVGIVENMGTIAPESLRSQFESAGLSELGLTVAERTARGIELGGPILSRAGRGIMQGLMQGLESLQFRPRDLMQQISSGMQSVHNNANRSYTNMARDMMRGLNQGLLNGEENVMTTARRIAENIASTMKEALDINSPSRLMREQIGRQIPAGVAAGIDKYADYALDSMSDLGKELIKVNIPNINDMISMGPSLNISGTGIGNGASNIDKSITNHNEGMFEGAHIHWHNKEDIRQTMKEIAWTIYREEAVL